MRHALRVLLVGPPGPFLTQVEELLGEQRQMRVTTRAVTTGETYSLSDPQLPCDVIVLVVDEHWRATLGSCFGPDATAKKPLLVLGPVGDVELLRMSMRIGSRDYFSLPVGAADLLPALDRVAKEEHERHGALAARVTTFINAKGGSGASFCAANFAHILAKGFGRRTVLMDFELQFGSLPIYFNLQPNNGLIRALELADTLDATALQGYTQRHSSGLYLLAAAADGLLLPEDIHGDRVAKLFAVMDEAYEELVIDLPRHINRASVAVLDRSDLILLIVQQTVAHLHELKRLAVMLQGELGIPAHRLVVVISRYQKPGEVAIQDFADALRGLRIETLPNDFRAVSQSINLGVPLLDYAPGSALCKALKGMVESVIVGPVAPVPQKRGRWSWIPGLSQ